MDWTAEQIGLEHRAIKFAKANRTEIANELTDKKIYIPEKNPVSVFMAGSPGAGKTEVSKSIVSEIEGSGGKVIRLDPDDLREQFVEYNGSNSFLFQRAVSAIVERTLDKAFSQNQSFLLDGTFSKMKIAEKNIERSLRKGRSVLIIFVYQKPELAWEFVKAREVIEGRKILPEHFIEQYFGCQTVIASLKEKYGNGIRVDLVLKDNDGKMQDCKVNITALKPYLKSTYTECEVRNIVNKID